MFLPNDIDTGFSLKCQVFISLPKGGGGGVNMHFQAKQ